MTTETQDAANAFLMGSGGRSAEFKQHGDEVDGIVVSAEPRQQTDYTTNAPKEWEDGNPMMQLVVTLQTSGEPIDDEDDLLRKVYVKAQMTVAVRDAVKKAGENGLANGGRLAVRYVGDAEPKREGMSGAKQYVAKYAPPTGPVPADPEQYDEPPPQTDEDFAF